MTALVGFVATMLCLTSMFCIVKLIARYRSGETPIPQVPGSPVPWDGMVVASLFVLVSAGSGCFVLQQYKQCFLSNNQAPQVIANREYNDRYNGRLVAKAQTSSDISCSQTR